MPSAFGFGDAAIQRSKKNAASVCLTGGSSGSGAATVSTRHAKIDASRAVNTLSVSAAPRYTATGCSHAPARVSEAARARRRRGEQQERDDEPRGPAALAR